MRFLRWTLLVPLFPLLLSISVTGAEPYLETVRRVQLAKTSGRVEPIEPRPRDGFVVRDYTWEPPEGQVIELYSNSGTLERGEYDLDLEADGALDFVHGPTRALFRRPSGERDFTRIEIEGRKNGDHFVLDLARLAAP